MTEVSTYPPLLAAAIAQKGKLHDGPDVVRLAQEIAQKFPHLAAYCANATPTTAWCGIFIARLLAQMGIEPPYDPNDDTGSFMFVDGWAKTNWGALHIQPGQEQPGDIIPLRVPHHVTILKEVKGDRYICVGGNQTGPSGNPDSVTESSYARSGVMAIIRPPASAGGIVPPPDTHPLIKIGSAGAVVLELQKRLGVDADGDFGPITDAAVRNFQLSYDLEQDGEVGPDTWRALLTASNPNPPAALLTQRTIDAIIAAAAASDLMSHNWSGRGRAPAGYIKGMAVVYGLVYAKYKAGDSSARAMAAPVPAGSKDALAWYEDKFRAADMVSVHSNPELIAIDTLRTLFVLLTGLGMRESSGRYCEGRDMSASNVAADTAESGLFQQSWNSHTASPEIRKLFDAYGAGTYPGLVEIFSEGVRFTETDNFGDGDGEAFQRLAKKKPAFAVEAAAVGLRVLRTHWGPIARREAEIVPAADALFQQVQSIVDAQPQQAPQVQDVKKGIPPMTEPTETATPNPQLPLPSTLPLPKLDVLQGLHYIVSGDRDKVRTDLKLFLDVFNSKHPEVPIALPAAPAAPAPDATPIHKTLAFQLGGVGVGASAILYQLHAFDPNMTILAGIISAVAAFMGPSGVVVAGIATSLGKAIWNAVPANPPPAPKQ